MNWVFVSSIALCALLCVSVTSRRQRPKDDGSVYGDDIDDQLVFNAIRQQDRDDDDAAADRDVPDEPAAPFSLN